MNALEQRIIKDGIVKEGNVLKVDSFLNHQMDIELFEEMAREYQLLHRNLAFQLFLQRSQNLSI